LSTASHFFSNGVNVIATGATRESYRPAHPEYATWRHYPNVEAWADATLARLRAWNFNTIGGWSNEALCKRGTLPYTVVLDLSNATRTVGRPVQPGGGAPVRRSRAPRHRRFER
jgi:hypothetical protein